VNVLPPLLAFFALAELVVGVGLRNEALAARGRAEVFRRQSLVSSEKALEYSHLSRTLCSPYRLQERLEWKRAYENVNISVL
jgi:hypothetical protein